MSVTFKYLLTGATVTFTHQVDIDSMKGHPEYERVEEIPAKEEAPPTVVTKKMGRPSKADQLAQLEALQ
jgi:hypothetical protein